MLNLVIIALMPHPNTIYAVDPPTEPNSVLLLNLISVSDGIFSESLIETGLENEDDPTANTYCIIGNFESDTSTFRDVSGYYTFKLIYRYDDPSIPDDILEWKQKTWLTSAIIIDEDTDLSLIPSQSGNDRQTFKGLGRSSSSAAYLDGDASLYVNVWNAVGPTRLFNGGIPAFNQKYASSQSLFVVKSIPSRAMEHEYPGEYQLQALTDGCSFDFPHSPDDGTQINVKDGIHVGIDIVRGLLAVLGPINPAFGIISGVILLSKGGFSGIPSLMHDEANDPAQQIYSTMADMFDSLWVCTEKYVSSVVDQAIEDLEDAIWEENEIRMRDRIHDLRTVLAELETKDDEARFNAFYYDNDAIHDQIDDMMDEFPNSREDGKECRALIPLIIEAMNIKIYAYYIYYQLAKEFDADYDGTAASLGKAGTFRRENVKLMKLYLQCSQEAYNDILLNSQTFPIEQLQDEIELIFNENAFCSWIDFTLQLSDSLSFPDPYDFDFGTRDPYDFTIFANGCDKNILKNIIINGNINAAGNMRLNDYYDAEQDVTLNFITINTITCHGIDGNPGGCASFINDMNNLDKYYFAKEGGRNTIRLSECEQCKNLWDQKYSKSIACNDNPEFGERYPNRIKTGLRYIIEYDSNNQKPLIVGYEFLCTNPSPNNYDGWHTMAGFSNDIKKNRYDWSPWFICPMGKKLQIVGSMNGGGCYAYETRDIVRNPFTNRFDTRCSTVYDWRFLKGSGIRVECIDA